MTKGRQAEYQEIIVKGNQISQVKKFDDFPCLGRCKSLVRSLLIDMAGNNSISQDEGLH